MKPAMLFLICLALALPAALQGQVIVREIPAPSANAVGLAWDGAALWVSDYSANLYRVDPQSGAVIRTVAGPVNGSDGLAFENGFLWTISRVASRVRIFRVDTLSGAAVDSIPDASLGYAGGATWDGSALWLSGQFPTDRYLRVNPDTGDTLRTMSATAQQPWGLAWDGSTLWNVSVDSDSDRVYRIDPATGAVLWSFTLDRHPVNPNRRPRGLAWDGSYLWLLAYDETTSDIRIYQYDIDNAENPDVDFSALSYDFGPHVVGFPVTWTTTAGNVGNVPLVFDSARFGLGAAFNLTVPAAFPVSVPAEATQPFTIRFDPPAAGTFVDTLRVYSNDPDEDVVTIAVSGVGLANESDIEVTPQALNFGNVRINNAQLSASRSLEIRNMGAGELVINSFQLLGDPGIFRWDPVTFPLEIDSQATYTTRIWFDPAYAQPYNATLIITCNDPDESLVEVVLEGTGVQESVAEGEALWYYEVGGDNYDLSINSVHRIPDVDGDGVDDVVAASGNHLIYCLNGSATTVSDTFWTYDAGADPDHSGIVYYERGMNISPDLNFDGIDDVIIGTTGGSRSVIAISGLDGEELWMFDTRFWGDGGWVYEVYPIEDVNSDGVPDVVAAASGEGSTQPRRVFAVSGADGTLLWGGNPSGTFYSVRTIEDVTGDGIDDVVGGMTNGRVYGYNGATGDSLWRASVESGSPVFALLAMGNANPGQTQTEDVLVASAYSGVYALEGADGSQIWFFPIGANVYEIAVGGDVTGDGVNEVYYGTSSLGGGGGIVGCLDGVVGSPVWSITADPVQARNILTLLCIPDLTGDGIPEVITGTLGRNIVVLNGATGEREWTTIGVGPASEADALGVLPDLDGNGSWEILAGMRDGIVQAISGGQIPTSAPQPRPTPVAEFQLGIAFPNPFNSTTRIPYVLPETGPVTLTVYDVLGRQVGILVDAVQPAGAHSVVWHARNSGGDLPSGMYYLRLRSGERTATRPLLLLK